MGPIRAGRVPATTACAGRACTLLREPRMTLTQLEHVLAAHKTGSFSRAARACGITQAAPSNSVAKLEEELGDRIFARTTRRIVLTPFGQKILPHIVRALGARDAILDVASYMTVR
jgi:DNA-binding transcriptional LysR family regulator